MRIRALSLSVGKTLLRHAHKLVLPGLVLIGGVLFGRAQLMDSITGFGAGYIGACAASGLGAPLAFAGVVLGALSRGLTLQTAAQLLSPAIVLLAWCALSRTALKSSRGAYAAVVAGARLAMLPWTPLLIYYLIFFLLELMLCMALYVAMCTVVDAARAQQPPRAQDTLMSLAVFLGVAVCALPQVGGFSLAYCMAVLLSLVAGLTMGAGAGVCAGLGMGLMCALGAGEGFTFAVVLGAGALCGVAFARLGRGAMASALVLAAVLVDILSNNMAAVTLRWPELLSAVLLFAFMPAELWQKTGALIRLQQEPPAPMRNAQVALARGVAVARMSEFARCLEELAAVFVEMSASQGPTPEELAPLLEAVADEACHTCTRCDQCWRQDFYGTYHIFMQSLTRGGRRRVLLESDFPESFRHQCEHFEDVLAALRRAWSLFAVKTGFKQRMGESRSLLARQLTGISQVMEDLANRLNLQIRHDGDTTAMAREALLRAGIQCQDVQITYNQTGDPCVELSAPACNAGKRCRQIEQELSRALGAPMRRAGRECGQPGSHCALQFYQVRSMRVVCAGAQRALEGVCGDACAWQSLGEQGYMMAISDGMGTGARAAMESSATLSLLQRFYKCGFDDEVVLGTINQVLLLRSLGESYSTVDLCKLNLIDGEADFIKIGAAPSFILREGRVLSVVSPALPLGVLEDVHPAVVRRVLQDDDILVLLSDGVLGGEGDWQWLEALLPALADLEPLRLCERLLEEAARRFTRNDDMTVVAARVRMPRSETVRQYRRVSHWRDRILGTSAASYTLEEPPRRPL